MRRTAVDAVLNGAADAVRLQVGSVTVGPRTQSAIQSAGVYTARRDAACPPSPSPPPLLSPLLSALPASLPLPSRLGAMTSVR